jgi:hypothetical protein
MRIGAFDDQKFLLSAKGDGSWCLMAENAYGGCGFAEETILASESSG